MKNDTILKNAIIDKTGIRKTERKRLVDISVIKTGDFEPAGIATKEEYLIDLHIRNMFWCNKAQYDHALLIAQKAVLVELFSPILSISARLKKAAMDDDFDEVFFLATELENQCGL